MFLCLFIYLFTGCLQCIYEFRASVLPLFISITYLSTNLLSSVHVLLYTTLRLFYRSLFPPQISSHFSWGFYNVLDSAVPRLFSTPSRMRWKNRINGIKNYRYCLGKKTLMLYRKGVYCWYIICLCFGDICTKKDIYRYSFRRTGGDMAPPHV